MLTLATIVTLLILTVILVRTLPRSVEGAKMAIFLLLIKNAKKNARKTKDL